LTEAQAAAQPLEKVPRAVTPAELCQVKEAPFSTTAAAAHVVAAAISSRVMPYRLNPYCSKSSATAAAVAALSRENEAEDQADDVKHCPNAIWQADEPILDGLERKAAADDKSVTTRV